MSHDGPSGLPGRQKDFTSRFVESLLLCVKVFTGKNRHHHSPVLMRCCNTTVSSSPNCLQHWDKKRNNWPDTQTAGKQCDIHHSYSLPCLNGSASFSIVALLHHLKDQVKKDTKGHSSKRCASGSSGLVT